jgi:hypothetical protein
MVLHLENRFKAILFQACDVHQNASPASVCCTYDRHVDPGKRTVI